MPINFLCEQCGRQLRVGDDAAGKQAKCPQCGAVQDVPGPAGADLPNPFSSLSGLPPPPHLGSPPPASSGPSGEFNPYQSPATSMPQAMPPVIRHVDALSQVSAPAIGLIVVGAIGGVSQVLSLLLNALNLAIVPQMANRGGDGLQIFTSGIGLVFAVLAMLIAGVIIYGAIRMKNLESYPWAMAASILAMIPCMGPSCLHPCCAIGIPVGIWSVVVLANVDVRSAFPN